VGQWESGQFPKIYNSIIMDLHIKLEHNLVHKIIRLISKGYILIMYPCVAFVVALLIALVVAAGATVSGAAGAGVALATAVAVALSVGTAVAAVAVGVHYQH
jgi:hypothetical protein